MVVPHIFFTSFQNNLTDGPAQIATPSLRIRDTVRNTQNFYILALRNKHDSQVDDKQIRQKRRYKNYTRRGLTIHTDKLLSLPTRRWSCGMTD
jgi:hypothetical protein